MRQRAQAPSRARGGPPTSTPTDASDPTIASRSGGSPRRPPPHRLDAQLLLAPAHPRSPLGRQYCEQASEAPQTLVGERNAVGSEAPLGNGTPSPVTSPRHPRPAATRGRSRNPHSPDAIPNSYSNGASSPSHQLPPPPPTPPGGDTSTITSFVLSSSDDRGGTGLGDVERHSMTTPAITTRTSNMIPTVTTVQPYQPPAFVRAEPLAP